MARLMVGLLLAMVTAACTSPSEAGGRVFFDEPLDGAVVVSPVSVVMRAEEFIIEPASEGVRDGRGHFHIMIDRPCVDSRLTVGADERHLHFGTGKETAALDLDSGQHTLCLQVADGFHTALALTHEITITVE